MIDKDLLDILVCPESRCPLRVADARLLDRVNAAIQAGVVLNKAGRPVTAPLQSSLVRQDNLAIYPIVDDIPVLLVDEAIPLAQIP